MTLIQHLTLVEESRSDIMSGAEGWRDIETYGNSKADWLRQWHPAPSHH